MAEIIWTDAALQDLDNIAEYIALENVQAAEHLVQTVFEKVERLGLFPKSGQIPAELTHLNYLEIVVNPCRIFYKLEKEQVIILFVMRQEMDLRKFMINR